MMALEGVLVLDKPEGPTSHDIVEKVRRFTRRQRVGHTGTLDPMATGVLPICIGRATRLARFLTASRKQYAGTLQLGVTTDTYDATGQTRRQRPAGGIGLADVQGGAARLTGDLMQTPPAFSARKIKGQPMHRLARAGQDVPLKPTPVTVYRFEILGMEESVVRFEAETSPGTYIRSLAHDLGEILGCGAHLTALRRIASGSFGIDSAHTLADVVRDGHAGTLASLMIPLDRIDLGMPTIMVTSDGAAAMRHGRALSAGHMTHDDTRPEGFTGYPGGPGPVRVADEGGRLLGVAVYGLSAADTWQLRPDVVLTA